MAETPGPIAQPSSEAVKECEERARTLANFGEAGSPLWGQPWSSASQWGQASGQAALNPALWQRHYRECLEAKTGDQATRRAP